MTLAKQRQILGNRKWDEITLRRLPESTARHPYKFNKKEHNEHLVWSQGPRIFSLILKLSCYCTMGSGWVPTKWNNVERERESPIKFVLLVPHIPSSDGDFTGKERVIFY